MLLKDQETILGKDYLFCSPTVFPASAVRQSETGHRATVTSSTVKQHRHYVQRPCKTDLHHEKLIFYSNSYRFTAVVTTLCLGLAASRPQDREGSYWKKLV